MPNVSFDCISTSVRCKVNGAGVARLSRKLAFKSAVGGTSAAARFLIDVGRRGGRVLSRSVQPLLADQIERPSTPASPQHRSENAETPYKVSKGERHFASKSSFLLPFMLLCISTNGVRRALRMMVVTLLASL